MPEMTLDLHWQTPPEPLTTAAQIVSAYQSGTSLRIIATAHDTSVKAVKRVLTEAGVSVRKREPGKWAKCWG